MNNPQQPQGATTSALTPLTQDQLYSLIISQLTADGYSQAAMAVSLASGVPPPQLADTATAAATAGGAAGAGAGAGAGAAAAGAAAGAAGGGGGGGGTAKSRDLFELVSLGLRAKHTGVLDTAGVSAAANLQVDDDLAGDGSGRGVKRAPAGPVPRYVSNFVTKHNMAATAGAFSRDGMYMATGSEDSTLKLLDVSRMKRVHTMGGHTSDFARRPENKPVIQPFYDHKAAITDLAFHPWEPILVSSSLDCTVRMFKTTTGLSQAFSALQDGHPTQALAFHPSGDFLLVGTADPALRIYDMQTQACFISGDTDNFHTGGIVDLAYDTAANLYVSGSADGSIKVWDGSNATVVSSISAAHSGAPVTSVRLTANGRYILSTGMDSTVRLWDLGSSRQLRVYDKHLATMPAPAALNHSETHILVSDESRGGAIVIYDVNTADIVGSLVGHKSPCAAIVASPVEDAFVSTSYDHFSRFWCA